MRKKHKFIFTVWLIVLLPSWIACAQPSLNQEDLPDRTVSEEVWRERTKGMDYGERENPEPEPENESLPEPAASDAPWLDLEKLSPVIMTVVIVLMTVLIIYLLVYRFRDGDIRAKARDAKTAVDLNEVEEKLESTDIQGLLKRALENGEHRTALRLYYLFLLQQMNRSELIRWSKEKTNFEYLLELNDEQLAREFKDLTIAYERVWYGDRKLDAGHFRQLEPVFEKLLTRVK